MSESKPAPPPATPHQGSRKKGGNLALTWRNAAAALESSAFRQLVKQNTNLVRARVLCVVCVCVCVCVEFDTHLFLDAPLTL